MTNQTTTPTQQVTLVGPNLPDQTRGYWHVHAAGCRDLRNYGGCPKQTFEAATRAEVAEVAAADMLGDCTTDAEYIERINGELNEMNFFPCTNLK